jgi:hypothetical protein
MALHSTPTILERALEALQEYDRIHGQAGPSAVLPFDQPPLIEKTFEPEPFIEPPEVPSVCRLCGAETYWWHRRDGGALCGKCHPAPFALASRETAQSEHPPMPDRVMLLSWELKLPPVTLSVFSVVNDTQRFVEGTLRQLDAALHGRCWGAGNRSVRDLCERLEQVGVRVEVVRGENDNLAGQ